MYTHTYIYIQIGYEVICSNGEFTIVFHTMDLAFKWATALSSIISKEQWVDKENLSINTPMMSMGMYLLYSFAATGDLF